MSSMSVYYKDMFLSNKAEIIQELQYGEKISEGSKDSIYYLHFQLYGETSKQYHLH
jgi:hypothetical protein